MNGYLVVLRHSMDDLPIGLYATEVEAIKAAKRTRAMPTKRICGIIKTDCSTPACVAVYSFEDGKLVQMVCVKIFN